MHSEARSFLDFGGLMIVVGTLLIVCVFTWIKGRRPEKLGAALYCVSAVATYLFEVISGHPPPVVIELAFDTLVAVGFLALAILYNNLWLGAAMIIKGVQLAVHATHLTDMTDPYFRGVNLYAASLNLISLLIPLTILGGTIASLRTQRNKLEAGVRMEPNGDVLPGDV